MELYNGDCSIFHKDEENIHLFRDRDLSYNVRSTINISCHNIIATNYSIIGWIEHAWSLKNIYHKFFYNILGKSSAILWAI